jgi:hypothetical protein
MTGACLVHTAHLEDQPGVAGDHARLARRPVGEGGRHHEQPLLADLDPLDPLHEPVDEEILAQRHEQGLLAEVRVELGAVGEPPRVGHPDLVSVRGALPFPGLQCAHVEPRIRALHRVQIHAQLGGEVGGRRRRLLDVVTTTGGDEQDRRGDAERAEGALAYPDVGAVTQRGPPAAVDGPQA